MQNLLQYYVSFYILFAVFLIGFLFFYFYSMFGKLGEMKKMYGMYRKLQKELKKLIIRAKQGNFQNSDGEEVGQVSIDINGEMKLQDLHINDESLLDISQKSLLEDTIKDCFQKAQNKAQEVVQQKTKDILGFDPSDLGGMMGGGGGMPKIPGMG